MTRCSSKRRHSSQRAAIAAAVRLSRSCGVPQRVYRCPFCHGWHLTKQTKRDPSATLSEPAHGPAEHESEES